MRKFLARLRSHQAVAAILYSITRPVYILASEVQTRIAKHVRRNGGTAVYDGIALHFPPDVGVAFLSAISWHGTQGFEPDTWAVLRQLIEKSGTFIDVGSNIGFYSVLAKRIAPQVDVLSFEPVPAIFKQSQKFHSFNGVSANIQEIALSDRDGFTTLYQPMETESSASTLVAQSWQARKSHNELSVETAKLDSLLANRTLRSPVTIKIDVEDHEASVLRGAAATIRKYKPAIVCEILPRPVRPDSRLGSQIIPIAEQHCNAETVAVLGELGYVAFAITAVGYFRFSAEDFRDNRLFADFLLLPSDLLPPERDYFRELPNNT